MKSPPRMARWLLERVLAESVGTFVINDLDERYQAYLGQGRLRANAWYWRQTIAALFAPLPGPARTEPPALGSDLASDVRSALRSMRRRPGQALAAVLTLAVGVGATATAFSVLHGTVLRGLPFEEADRLIHFERANLAEGRSSMAVTPHDYAAWREAQTTFEDLGAYVESAVTLPGDGAPPERLTGVRISANSFALLRVEPLLGRGFSSVDDRADAPPVILLSHGVWTRRFGADPGVVGRTLRFDEGQMTVVGVMPEWFGFPIAEQFWTPLRLDLDGVERGGGRLDVFGRLVPGATLERADADFDRIAAGLAAAYPDTNAGVTASLRTFHAEYVGEEFTRTAYRMLFGSALLLLLCCANVANLLLVRGIRQRADIALRVSLGATAGRIVRQLFTEALVLAGGGAALGAGFAWYGVEWFDRAGAEAGVFSLPHGSDSLFWWDVSLNGPALAFLVGVALLTATLAGLVPALGASRAAASGSLRTRGGVVSRRMSFAADALVVSQLALTTGLLVAAGLVTRSAVQLSGMDDVLDPEGVLATTASLPPLRFRDDPSRLAYSLRLVDALGERGELSAAAIGTRLPLSLPHSVPFEVDGGEATDESAQVGVVSVSRRYAEVFGVELEEGRGFEAGDAEGAPPVAIVNRSFATRYLPAGAVGARMRLLDPDGREPWVTVVGVIPDLWDRPRQPEREAGVYLPLAQAGIGDPATRLGRLGLRYPNLVVRGRPGAGASATTVRDVVFTLDPGVPVGDVLSMDEVVAQGTGRYRIWGRFYLTFAVVGTLLATLGVYGVLSFRVAQRTAEIGVRRALGASPGREQRRVMRVAGRPIVAGAALGLGLGWAFSGGLARILYGVDPRDPAVFGGVLAVVVVVGLMASWVPARRAASVDPVRAMRTE